MANTTLTELADLLAEEGLLVGTTNLPQGEVGVTGAACDSRMAREGDVFICKGRAFSPAFLASALEKGAVAYICDESHGDSLASFVPDACQICVSDIRRAMGIVSPVAWGHPDRDLTVIGITGTKGKTTTAYMLRSILDGEEPWKHAAIMGSVDIYDGIERFESVNTTPEAPDLWRHLANARDAGLEYMVMEVASQGLKYDRVLGLSLDICVFLNIGRDHISPLEHTDFDDYFRSKLKIFDLARVAVVNLDSAEAPTILDSASRCERVLTYSLDDESADLWASDIEQGPGFSTFTAHTPSWAGAAALGMGGLFNVSNALSALAVCEVLGIDAGQSTQAIVATRVPGRMELISSPGQRVVGLVDYAHNKLSYQAFGDSLAKEFPGRMVIALFGAPGDKAHERRTELPEEASKWADLIIYTEEDPAHEDPADICAEMAAATPAGQAFEVVVDRTEAIFRAVRVAYDSGRDVVVCLLAKGDETRQHVGDEFPAMEPDGSVFARALRECEAHARGAGGSGGTDGA